MRMAHTHAPLYTKFTNIGKCIRSKKKITLKKFLLLH